MARGKHSLSERVECIPTRGGMHYKYGIPCDVRIRTHLLEPFTKSLCRPMEYRSSKPTDDPPGVPTREVTPREQASPLTTQNVGTTRPAPQETRSGSETPQTGRMSPHERPTRDRKRDRAQSAPKRVQTKLDDEKVPPLPSQ